MDHIMISHDKLKLMLSDIEMEHYQLNIQELDGEAALTRQTFHELLEDVRRLSGFDAADDKVFIQLYPSRDGGAEIYITRIAAKKEDAVEKTAATIRLTTVFAFDSMQLLLEACAHMKHAEPQHSSAWREREKYYLVCEDQVACEEYLRGVRPRDKRKFIGDYGKIITDPAAFYYVKEHCLCFCKKNAVKILSSMV